MLWGCEVVLMNLIRTRSLSRTLKLGPGTRPL